jgi:ribonucleoside-diphosphate reductase alpha chain
VVRPRPEVLSGKTYKERTGCGSLYVTVNWDKDGIPFEVFIRAGKSGGCASSQCEALGRLVSTMLRGDLGIELAIEQLGGISCNSANEADHLLSCADGVSRALRKFNEDYKSQHLGVPGD